MLVVGHDDDAIRDARDLGYQIGLHTGGAYPRRLAEILSLIDWVGFDVKAPFSDYDRVTGVPGSGERAKASLLTLVESGVAADTRTTVHAALLRNDDLARLDDELASFGLGPSRRQPFRAEGCRDAELLAG